MSFAKGATFVWDGMCGMRRAVLPPRDWRGWKIETQEEKWGGAYETELEQEGVARSKYSTKYSFLVAR